MVKRSAAPMPVTIQTAVLAHPISTMLRIAIAPPSIVAAMSILLLDAMNNKINMKNMGTNATLLVVSIC